MSGWIAVAGLGPGAEALVTPEVSAALAEATDVVGYIPYVARIAPRPGLTLHPSDNRVELDRAALALTLAAEGRRVVIVSSGDPGVFAMASALFEALEAAPEHAGADIRILPGITAMLAAGHTPGHMVFQLESAGQRLLLGADMANHYVWSLAHPDWEVRYDMDKAQAAQTRRRLLGMLAADRVPFIGYHMPFPGVGFVEAVGEGFRFVPHSYQMML